MPFDTTDDRISGLATLADQFGRASLVVLVGVTASWLLIKLDVAEPTTELPDIGVPLVEMRALSGTDEAESLLDRADAAFAAGRIIEPEYDNALAHYLALQKQDPKNADAEAGIERVVGYLLSQGEGAIYRGDWDAARAYARVIRGIRANHAGADSITARANKLQRIDELNSRALAQFSGGKLTSPQGDNAAESYREMLALDPGNVAADQGLKSIAQRLATNAQSAALAGNTRQADQLISQAKSLDPAAAEVKEVEKASRQWQRIREDTATQNDLLAAAEALEADRLMPPDEPNAFTLFNRVLQQTPNSEAARNGIEMVRRALIDRGWRAMRAGELGIAATALALAVDAGAPEAALAEARAELGYQQRLADARNGKFERLYALNELTVRERAMPDYPRAADKRQIEGSVLVEFTVDERGAVRDPVVLETTNTVFDRSALSAINRWEFAPVMENGRPVPVRSSIRFTFKPS